MIEGRIVSAVAGGALEMAVRLAARPLFGVIINEHWLSADETRAHVTWLARRFDLIHHDELRARLSRRAARPFCLLTFDDGKRSNAIETAPELARMGVPAAFYVTTSFIGGTQPLWFDRLAALVRALGRVPAALDARTLKRLPLAAIDERIDRACRTHGVAVDGGDARIAAMSWDDVRALAGRGFTVGAHGIRHTVLTSERSADARGEIAGSLLRVGCELGAPCKSFAFPNGNYTEALARYALACGAETVMTTEPTWVGPGARLWCLPRVQLFPGSTRARIELKLAVAATGRILANPDGTGRRYIVARRGGAATESPT